MIGVADPMKGQLPRGFVVLKAGVERDPDEIGRELVALVRDEIGAVAAFRDVTVVAGLPKTRSGKILRKTMREIADGKDARGAVDDRGHRACSTRCGRRSAAASCEAGSGPSGRRPGAACRGRACAQRCGLAA